MKGANMQKSIRGIRVVSMVLVILMFSLMFATSALASIYYGPESITNGQYRIFANHNWTDYKISANTVVNHNIDFTTVARPTVQTGECWVNGLGNYVYNVRLSGNSTLNLNGNFTISSAGNYRFFIYNGSAATMRMSSFYLTF
jgi:hypothetical protein